MEEREIRRRIALAKKERVAEERRRGLRVDERKAIMESRTAKRERRAASFGLAFEKAKIYKALPFPRVGPRDEEEELRRSERSAKREGAKAKRQIALSQRRVEV